MGDIIHSYSLYDLILFLLLITENNVHFGYKGPETSLKNCNYRLLIQYFSKTVRCFYSPTSSRSTRLCPLFPVHALNRSTIGLILLTEKFAFQLEKVQ